MTQEEKDTYYLDIAKAVAIRSTCLFGDVGCVIVDADDNLISTGYLAYNDDIINCRQQGYCSYAEHEKLATVKFGVPETCDYMFPEVNAIINADRTRLKKGTMYIYAYDRINNKPIKVQIEKTVSKIILKSGIKRIVLSKDDDEE